jgi:hypothetical protein
MKCRIKMQEKFFFILHLIIHRKFEIKEKKYVE